ncbi:HlyD family efflux transporter periplasmic adaptor subunit [Alkalimarinus alittae]|uniref:Biotin/lipoyl-binding protein n=1 Tax=Alkalimarinus alittae TaxID=2961619 RepID=A0ABY6N541_9ALTE|nr:biotin/lipoyl-binding protein [Alkalimarinus alittae]UZE97242.1 biotin/lipoyl-binding protein [Alkalimarinus alittae]
MNKEKPSAEKKASATNQQIKTSRTPAQNSAEQTKLSVLLHLEKRALAAQNNQALSFVIANETHLLTPYRQSLIMEKNIGGQFILSQASGLAHIVEDSPFSIWLQSMVASLDLDGHEAKSILVQSESIREDLQPGWLEWLPEQLLIIPVLDSDNNVAMIVLYAREQAWSPLDLDLLHRLHDCYAYCYRAMDKGENNLARKLRQFISTGRLRWAAMLIVLALFIPVRLSVLAPAEVVALNAKAVASPIDGVIGEIYVQPNAVVNIGDALFSLDDSALQSRKNIALKALVIARADALVAEQQAFNDYSSKADLASALGRVREKEAELGAVELLLQRVTVKADRKGLAIFADKNDWIGRPVQVGERIMQLASAEDAGIEIWLPVADAINLDIGAPIRVFLHTQPLSPLDARLLQTSYQTSQSPEGVSSYTLFGHFNAENNLPRLGLRGTARISSDWTILGYYLFRRPIAALREFTGL